MKSIPKLLAYRNKVPSSMFMPEHGNWSHIYARVCQLIPCLCKNMATNLSLCVGIQYTILSTSHNQNHNPDVLAHNRIFNSLFHGIQFFNNPYLRVDLSITQHSHYIHHNVVISYIYHANMKSQPSPTSNPTLYPPWHLSLPFLDSSYWVVV